MVISRWVIPGAHCLAMSMWAPDWSCISRMVAPCFPMILPTMSSGTYALTHSADTCGGIEAPIIPPPPMPDIMAPIGSCPPSTLTRIISSALAIMSGAPVSVIGRIGGIWPGVAAWATSTWHRVRSCSWRIVSPARPITRPTCWSGMVVTRVMIRPSGGSTNGWPDMTGSHFCRMSCVTYSSALASPRILMLREFDPGSHSAGTSIWAPDRLWSTRSVAPCLPITRPTWSLGTETNDSSSSLAAGTAATAASGAGTPSASAAGRLASPTASSSADRLSPDLGSRGAWAESIGGVSKVAAAPSTTGAAAAAGTAGASTSGTTGSAASDMIRLVEEKEERLMRDTRRG
eukprot:m.29321 g.29321  ORF g.29321 m.29321 type:complete len:346 (-) comp12099_c0_seq2:85-1122(-)